MLRRLKAKWTSWRFKRLTRPFDRRIAEARAKHAAVRAIEAEKRAFVHAALRGRG